jgi:hypothetical protein
VPCLAIVEDLKSGEIILLHCDQDWDLLGVGGKHESLAQAKRSAERAYLGISSRWIDARITQREALKFRAEMWRVNGAASATRIPPDFNKMVERNSVRICDLCIAKFQKILAEEPQSKE